jgi:hypothetical protein
MKVNKSAMLIILFITSCINNFPSEETTYPSIDSTVVDSVSLDSGVIVNYGTTDTVAVPPFLQEEKNKKSAVLGYSFIPTMRKLEVKDLNVFISAKNKTSKVIDTLKTIVQEQSVTDPKDTTIAILDTQNIAYYKYITLDLLDPDSAFKIEKIHYSNRQEIDSLLDNSWHWTIKALTDKSYARLIIKVGAEKTTGGVESLKNIYIPIEINIESPYFWKKTYSFLNQNPEYLLSSILIPLAIFIVRRFFSKNDNAN